MKRDVVLPSPIQGTEYPCKCGGRIIIETAAPGEKRRRAHHSSPMCEAFRDAVAKTNGKHVGKTHAPEKR